MLLYLFSHDLFVYLDPIIFTFIFFSTVTGNWIILFPVPLENSMLHFGINAMKYYNQKLKSGHV
jgi:hypothetical protein